MPFVLIQPLLNRLRCIFGFVSWWIGVLLENLQFGQGNDITICRFMPDGLLLGAVVVVKSIGLRIEELPPLRRVGTLYWDALQTEAITKEC